MKLSLAQKRIAVVLLLMLPALHLFAQNAQPEVKEQMSSNNLLAGLLIATTIILALVIFGMGRALLHISRMVMEKSRKEKQGAVNATLLIVALLLAQVAPAQETITKTIPNYGGLSQTLFILFAIVIGIEITAIFFLAFFIKRLYAELVPETVKAVKTVKQHRLWRWWKRMDEKLFTRAVPVAAEADVMLDHDYDGIRELDNALPPWWKYGFYITIFVAVFYLFHFHVSGSGKNPDQEYIAEIARAKEQKARYDELNKDKVDEDHVPMADAAGISFAKSLYTTNCVSCHGEKGEGGAGPNLTDDYWIHKGSLNDIYRSIKIGYPDKGMQPWIQKFNPKEISQLASFIKTLHGTKPANPKAPQGDLFVDETPTADSVVAKNKPLADSVVIKNK